MSGVLTFQGVHLCFYNIFTFYYQIDATDFDVHFKGYIYVYQANIK